MTALLDLLPLIAFFFASKKFGLIAGAAAVLVSTLAVYGVHLARQKGKLTKQQWTVLLLTIVFCGASILLQDDLYLRWKTPVINLLFALALGISALIGKPLIQAVAKDIFRLSPRGWLRLTWVWAAFFLLLAALHYWIGLYAYDETSESSKNLFINFKSYGQLILMIVFMLAQGIVLRGYLNTDAEAANAPEQEKQP
ncbi:inner membrane-spanning protein YciB [Neisseria shayeganii]|uniref:Inner membrane-spanning protein YciB n=1 Tax=Neisseria shayeganii 871 TaxID=1032488 RepID=G4CGN7_9NEIS|nr:septation protein IspZ [Neisseria shayeganii]EGY52990.1 intracellular septation protein A [Neisseria shayeganii 871]